MYLLIFCLPSAPPRAKTKAPWVQGFSALFFISVSPGLAVVFGTGHALHKLLSNEPIIGLFQICYLLQ